MHIIGDNQRLMKVESTLAKLETVDGVRYELWNGAALREQRATIRVYDTEVNEVVQIRQYPDYDRAESAYLDMLAKVR